MKLEFENVGFYVSEKLTKFFDEVFELIAKREQDEKEQQNPSTDRQ